VRIAATLACSRWPATSRQGLDLHAQALKLTLDELALCQRAGRDLFTILLERAPGQPVEAGPIRLDLARLDLQLLLRGVDVCDAPAYALQRLELLLVRQVERVGRVLHSIERPVGPRPEEQLGALPQSHGFHCPCSRVV
jgi:hypothetical protein